MEEMFEPAMTFLASPWKIWVKGSFEMRRLVLRLAFAERISYNRQTGLRTPTLALPFKALQAIECGNSAMARPEGLSSNALFDTLHEWNEQLRHVDFDDWGPQP